MPSTAEKMAYERNTVSPCGDEQNRHAFSMWNSCYALFSGWGWVLVTLGLSGIIKENKIIKRQRVGEEDDVCEGEKCSRYSLYTYREFVNKLKFHADEEACKNNDTN